MLPAFIGVQTARGWPPHCQPPPSPPAPTHLREVGLGPLTQGVDDGAKAVEDHGALVGHLQGQQWVGVEGR